MFYFSRFQELDAPERWTQASRAISLLPVNEFVVTKLIENAHLYRGRLNSEIRQNFNDLCTRARNTAAISDALDRNLGRLENIISGNNGAASSPKRPRRQR